MLPELEMKEYSVTSRPMKDLAKIHELADDHFGVVTSVFGFHEEFTPLYGGRIFSASQVYSFKQVDLLASIGVAFTVTLTSDYFEPEWYKKFKSVIAEFIFRGNKVTVTNDLLAMRLKEDFPGVKLIASVIKGIDDIESIDNALELYDFVTLHPRRTEDIDFLNRLTDKSRIILFKNAGCLYWCSQPFQNKCYRFISKAHEFWGSGLDGDALPCLRSRKSVKVDFDISSDIYRGFKYFKKPLQR